MSAEQMDTRKGEVLLDFQKTEDEIAGLRSTLTGIGDVCEDFAKRLKHSPETSLYLPNQAHHSFNVEQYPQQTLLKLRELERAFGLSDKLREALEHLQKLKQEKNSLGLR